MREDLPDLTFQRKLSYRPTHKEVKLLHTIINEQVFDNLLPKPSIVLASRCREYMGMCISKNSDFRLKHSNCIIKLSDKWFCRQWLITILAHEMCHQYEWDIIGKERLAEGREPKITHGPNFFMHKERLAEHGIRLKRVYKKYQWFEHQSLFENI